jgi:hypothetical protein
VSDRYVVYDDTAFVDDERYWRVENPVFPGGRNTSASAAVVYLTTATRYRTTIESGAPHEHSIGCIAMSAAEVLDGVSAYPRGAVAVISSAPHPACI